MVVMGKPIRARSLLEETRKSKTLATREHDAQLDNVVQIKKRGG